MIISKVAQSCLTLCDSMGYSLPGSSVHGTSQARVLEWVAISFSRGSSQPRDWTPVSCIADRHFTAWATREAPGGLSVPLSKFLPLCGCGIGKGVLSRSLEGMCSTLRSDHRTDLAWERSFSCVFFNALIWLSKLLLNWFLSNNLFLHFILYSFI